MKDTLTLDELSEQTGVEVARLQRMVRVGSLPEARKQTGPDSDSWVIPVDALPSLAARYGWTVDRIDLTPESRPVVSVVPEPGTGPASDHTDAPTDAPGDVGRNIEVRTGSLTPVRSRPSPGDPTVVEASRRQPVTMAEVVDQELLGHLLGAHEEKAGALARAAETERALASMTASHRQLVRELTEERSERHRLAERLREEQYSRRLAEAKVAELRAWIDREMTNGEREKRARQEAMERCLQAEREASAAVGAMGWVSRRRYDRNERASRRP